MKTSMIFVLIASAIWAQAAAAQSSAWQQRIMREQVVARVGPVARPIVESPFANEACWALSSCSWHVAIRLAEFHNSGELAKRPMPGELLRAIGMHGDVVAWYVMQHPELCDTDCCIAFVNRPLDISLNVCPLESAAAEVRAARLRGQSWWPPDTRLVAGGAGVVILGGLFIWWRRRRGV
ncbi:MAG TPA: hypothetical protein VFE62_09670 [Gemmataceae bacterium]|nr:hypothetical protein [Gemmataceae bacterium]